MKIAIIGSRGIHVMNIENYLPEDITEIISGGAKGVDTTVREYAETHGIVFTEILPVYARYGRYAPLKRNLEIISQADAVIAFWDGKSPGTKHVIDNCEKCGKKITVYLWDESEPVR